ncbi:MAG: excinuclease ABC subunit UvrC [Candidatus Levybacteria bacterium]|nr:excinuclease ABC subunit UvrC [Candidatus Levybacteria bacterium]
MPQNFGIYIFLNHRGNTLYVGKAKNLKSRVSSYFRSSAELGEKTKQLVGKVKKIRIIKTQSEIESLLLEAYLIQKYKPFYNIRLSDNKSYPLIRITIKEKNPAVLLSRKEDDKKSIYFGRYPSSSSARSVLRTVRRIFPYQSVVNHAKRRCLYNHIGLCPCPPLFTTGQDIKEYRKNILRIVQFLKGNSKKVLRQLEGDRNLYSRRDEFEKAAAVQRQISAIEYITSPTYKPFAYEVNPNLEEDLRRKEMDSLIAALKEKGVGVENLNRIECYDISNISGKFAVGSMVVFENGEKNTSQYKRFKIKETAGPNDFAMMQEVLRRRFKRDGWAMPDLIVIDGGKGQISAALKVLRQSNIDIPVLGLAKRLETIITSDLQEISLPRGSDPLNLVMKIRDEAHRFAITYHRRLRSKSING